MVLLFAAGVFALRVSARRDFTPCDFAMYYTASCLWLSGGDPYSRPASLTAWINAGGQPDIMPQDVRSVYGLDWMPIILTPADQLLLCPFALLRPLPSFVAWQLITLGTLLAALGLLAHSAGFRLLSPACLILTSVLLLYGPTHEIFGYGQPSGMTIGLVIAGLALSRRHDWLAGLALGVACALKPQLGVIFILYFVLCGRWRVVTAAGGAAAAAFVAAIVPLQLRGIDWLSGWRANLAVADQPGGMNDTAPGTLSRFYQLHLDMIVDPLLHRWPAASLTVVAGILLTLAVSFAARAYRAGRRDPLLEWSFASVLTLLFVYHRFYDGLLMLVPMTWAAANLRSRPITASVALTGALSFLLPAATTRRAALLFFHHQPEEIQHLWWSLGLEPWRTWVLLACAVAFIAAARRNPRRVGVMPSDMIIGHPRLAASPMSTTIRA